MRVLITGSSGQIGTNLGLHLLTRGHEVFGIDIRPNHWTQRIPMQLQDLTTTDAAEMIGREWPTRPDVVVHLAAHAKVNELVEQPWRALENIAMVFNVLEYCRRHRLPLVFSSSREVYGNVRQYIIDEQHAEHDFMESPYAASKISGEALIYSYAQCYEMPYLVFRFSNVYGRYDNDLVRMERVIPLFMREIAAGRPITIYGGDKVLDFTWIDDCVCGISAGIERLVAGDLRAETINLAYGEGNGLTTLAVYIGEALGTLPNIRIAPSRAGEISYYVANISKAQKLLGYAPRVALREGIHKTVAWAREYSRPDFERAAEASD